MSTIGRNAILYEEMFSLCVWHDMRSDLMVSFPVAADQATPLSEEAVPETSSLENIQHKSITGITHRLTPLVSI